MCKDLNQLVNNASWFLLFDILVYFKIEPLSDDLRGLVLSLKKEQKKELLKILKGDTL
jgi:hypothetical protein|tara:strand:+ start:4965 stop:5138 length:174 start_codon:yes stop_codon:yes gene_type:complete